MNARYGVNNLVLTLLTFLIGCGATGQADVSDQNPPANPSTNSALVSLQFTSDYPVGTTDAKGGFLGGTEMNAFVTHQGKLYASNGYWKDEPGNDAYPGSQVLVKESASAPWQVDVSFGPDYYSTEALASITFTTDGAGNKLGDPVTLLLAGPAPKVQPNEGSVWSRDDATGTWTKMVLVANSTANRPENVRVIFDHVDSVTGIHYAFAGMTRAGIYRGVYDLTVPGRIAWETTPELPPSSERVISATEANGVLYAAVASNGNPNDQDGGLFKRIDGPKPRWELVYEWPANPDRGSNLRGLTAVPEQKGGTYEVLIGVLEANGTVVKLDPLKNNEVTVEYDYKTYYTDLWGSLGGGATLGAYNDMPKVRDPLTGEEVWLIGLWVNHPERATPPNNGSYYLVRHADGSYEHGNVYDLQNPVPAGSELRATRTITASPFPEDDGKVFYFGGYDAGGTGTKHNTAWIYKGVVGGVTTPDVFVQATSESPEEVDIPKEMQQRVDAAMNRLSQIAGLSDEQRSQIEPILLEMLLQARVVIQDTATSVETRQIQLEALLETTRQQIEPLLSETQRAGFGMVWGRVSQEVMERLE
jgi:hypothetical protein